jgi:hypothetical protein
MGRLSTGTILESTYHGQRHTAEVLSDGRITYASTIYDSLSAAAGAMKLAMKPAGASSDWVPSADGWSFWRTRDEKTGELVTLKEIRRQAAEDV